MVTLALIIAAAAAGCRLILLALYFHPRTRAMLVAADKQKGEDAA